jgi:hypothetical protein
VLTDIASGWTVAAPMLVREQSVVTVTIEEIRRALPFPLLGLDVDNDSAFINETVLEYCRQRTIELTRSRAYKKNDQAWIEQKNGSVVRRMVGYGRLEGKAAISAVAELHEAARLYVNFFLPSFKLQAKERNGARVTRKYDKPATPYERLLGNPRVTDNHKQQLRQTFGTLDPILLMSGIREAQCKIADLETGVSSVPPTDADQKLQQFVRNLGTAWKSGEIRATHRKQAKEPRYWRTRADPFESVWPVIESWLTEQPDINAKDLFQRLSSRFPDAFQDGQLRTLQRRVKAWRTAIARRLVLGHAGTEETTNTDEQEEELIA